MVNKQNQLSKMDSVDANENLELLFNFDSGKELVMYEVNNESLTNKKYQEVRMTESDVIAKTVQASVPMLTISELTRLAPNGIFTTTIDPASLSKLANGTYSTIVRKNGLISQHVGFDKIDISKINSFISINLAMQAMSIISGQHYLRQINSKLEKHTELLNELINFKHTDNKAIIKIAIKTTERIANKSMNEPIDIIDLHREKNEVDRVYEFYNDQCRQVYESMVEDMSLQAEKSKASKFTIPKIKSKKTPDKKAKEFINNLTKLNNLYLMSYEISKLSLQMLLVEVAVSIKLEKDAVIIEDLGRTFMDEYNRIFVEEGHKVIYKELISKMKSLNSEEISLQIIKEIYPNLKEMINKNEILESGMKFIENYNKQREVLYIPTDSEGQVRVFTEVIE